MADGGRANRPTSAVEKTRAFREGGDGRALLRPSSAGVWRQKPSTMLAKEKALQDSASEDSTTSRSSMSESSQHSAIPGLRDRVPKTGPSSRTSSATSSLSSSRPNSGRRLGGDSKKGGSGASDVWMMAPMEMPADRHGWDDGQPSRDKMGSNSGSNGGSHYVVRSERMKKLSRLPSEKDRIRLQNQEDSLQTALTNGGRSGKPYLDNLERLGRLYNSIAMQYLQQGEHNVALDLLQSAELLLAEGTAGNSSFDTLKGLTYNNLGCYFRREGMPMEALKWLRQAHDIEQRVGEDSSRSSTFLNLCAVYSLLGKHLEALQCAKQALKHLRAVLQRNPDASLSASVPGMEKIDTASMLAIAYHNIAVEQEYLSRFDEAVGSYRKALEVAERQCGNKSQLAAKIRLALAAAANAAQAATTTLDTETSVASLESRNVADDYLSRRARGGWGRDAEEVRPSARARERERERERERALQRERERSKKEHDMTIENLSMESLSESSSAGRGKREGRNERQHEKRNTLAQLPAAGGDDRETTGAAAERTTSAHESAGASGFNRLPSAGRSAANKGDKLVSNEESWGSERSPGSASSRERSKRPLSAARLPANDANSSLEGEQALRGNAVKRHSRKTARPRTAGRERMADHDREELLAMTDPSSSDAGEYEAVADDAGLSDNESQAAPRAGNKAWGDGEEGGEGASVFGGKSNQGESRNRSSGRPMSASRRSSGRPMSDMSPMSDTSPMSNMSAARPADDMSAARPADPLRAAGTSGKARTSRKTARPRTAGRERMRETDREDLLVLSSGSEDGGAYEYLSEGEDEPPRRSPAALRMGERERERVSGDHHSRSAKEVRVGRVSEDRAERENGNGPKMQAEEGAGGKRRANRPLSAGVSFNSPSNVVHMIRPQSAPAVRLDGRPNGAPRSARAGHVAEDGVDEDEDEDEEEDEEDILDSDEEEQVRRVPFVGGARSVLRPMDSGQQRVSRPGSLNQPPLPAAVNGGTGAPPLPELLRESDDDAEDEELDTKGILLQQTEVLTAELEKSKQREKELYDRISRLEHTRAAPIAAAERPPLPPTSTIKAAPRKTAFGLPEVGLDGLDYDEPRAPSQQQQTHKLALTGARALPPRPTNNVSRVRARSNNSTFSGGAAMSPDVRGGGQAAAEAVDDLAEIRELTASLRIAAQHKVSNSMPSSPAPSNASSAGGAGWKPPSSATFSSMAQLPHNSVTFDPLRPPASGNTGAGGGAQSLIGAKSATSVWSQSVSSSLPRGTATNTVSNTSPGDMSDSSRASSVSRPAALRPLPASRRRRQKAEASRAAQLERVAAQTLQDAWRAHVARSRVERRRALARRRAAKAMAGTQSNRRTDRTETDRREEVGRCERKPESRSLGLERPGGRSRQQSGAAQTRLVEDEKKKRRAALTVQRVVRGWQARRFVRETMDWSLVREAGRRARRPSAARGGGAWGYERISDGGGADESELRSTGFGRATPLHSTGVGEESLEGLLQDLGL